MDQQCGGGKTGSAIANSGSSLICKRVSSAGALVRQATPLSPSSNIYSVQQQSASLSNENLLLNDSLEKLRLREVNQRQCISQKPVLDGKLQCPFSSSTPKNSKQTVFHIDPVGGAEPAKAFNCDYNELKARYASMESAYEADRQKTNVLLAKKDAHIARLQDRVTSLEHRLESAMQRSPENNHSLISERDALLEKLRRLEVAFAAEKTSWESSLAECQKRFASAEKELDEVGRKRVGDLSNSPPNAIDQAQPTPVVSPSCGHCSYFRLELERAEKTAADVLRDKEQLQQENQRKEAVLSELSAEATELRVQLNLFNDERTSLKRRIRRFEEEHARRQDGGEKRTVDPTVVVDENLLLRKRLNEAQNYFEAMDIESEQQITSLTNQLDDLHSMLEQSQRDVTLLHNRLKELEHERDAAQAKIKTSENNFSRQQDIIEGLREDLDRQREKHRDLAKDRDDLLLQNASLSHEAEILKREVQKQREEIHTHLTDVSRELEQCKTKLREQEAIANVYGNDDAVAKLVILNRKIGELEVALQDRDGTVRMQQQQLTEMKKALQKEWKLALESSYSASMPSGLDRDPGNIALLPRSLPEERLLLHFQCLKNVVLKFITSSEYEAVQMVRAVAALLCLSPEEEQLIWDTLKWKMNSMPSVKSNLPQP